MLLTEINSTHKSIDEAIDEWTSSNRRMGCVAATNWFCSRVEGFYPVRLGKYTKEGVIFEHVVASNGKVRIDLSPYNDLPRDYNPAIDGVLTER